MDLVVDLHWWWLSLPRVLRLVMEPVLFLWGFWALYVLVMGLYRASLAKRLTAVTKVLALPWVVLGFAVDVVVQLTLANVIFLRLPHVAFARRHFRLLGRDWMMPSVQVDWLVTDRLQRYAADEHGGWRRDLAVWVCTHLLDPYDPTGDHC